MMTGEYGSFGFGGDESVVIFLLVSVGGRAISRERHARRNALGRE